MFHPALWKLLQLQWRGGYRQFRQSLKTVRGLFHLGFVIVMILYGIGSIFFAGMAMSQSPQISNTLDQIQNDLIAVGLFTFTCYAVLFSTGEATVYFTPSEVSFLFPAPLTRRQLLSYKMFKSFLGIFGLSLFMAIFTTRQFGMAIPRFLAIFMTICFLQLLTMNVAFARQVLREKIHQPIRILFGAIITILLLVAINQILRSLSNWEPVEYSKALHASTVANWILAPFYLFACTIRASNWPSWAFSATIVFLIDASLLILAYQLDALSLEAALATSEKMAARIKNIKAKGVWQAFGPVHSSVANRRIPQLPFWQGVGPIVWQKMTTTFRSSTYLLWAIAGAICVAAWVVYLVSSSNAASAPGSPAGAIVGIIAMGYISFLICLTMQNDIERVGFLKSLPIQSISIVIGDLLGFVILLSSVQSLFILVLTSIFPTFALWLLSAASLLTPFNFVLFAVDKLVFYVYPTRMAKGAPGDFQNSGKQMIFIALKMLMLLGAGLIVLGATLPGALILQSPLIAAISAAIALGIECAVLIFLLESTFDRFDPSVTIVS